MAGLVNFCQYWLVLVKFSKLQEGHTRQKCEFLDLRKAGKTTPKEFSHVVGREPDLPRPEFLEFPQKCLGDFPETPLTLWILLKSDPEVPQKFARRFQKFPRPPQVVPHKPFPEAMCTQSAPWSTTLLRQSFARV